MSSIKFIFQVNLIIFLFCISSVNGGITLESDSMQKIKSIINEKSKKHGHNNVLVVFDIDDTVLYTDAALGSDQWYEWQEHLIKKNDKSSHRVAQTYGDLLKTQGLLSAKLRLKLTDKILPSMFSDFRNNGQKVLALTSRNPGFSLVTLNELQRNAISFKKVAIGKSDPYLEYWYPYAPDQKTISHLFEKELLKEFKLPSKARSVYFVDGVLFAAGQNKGVMLKIILDKFNITPKSIIFVDDTKRHVLNMNQVFLNNDKIDYVGIRYNKYDYKTELFNKKMKELAIKQWNILKKAYTSSDTKVIKKIETNIFFQSMCQ